MKNSEIVYKAANHIAEYGHNKGKYYPYPISLMSEESTTAPACAMGALYAVGGFSFKTDDLAEDLATFLGVGFIPGWNDDPKTTAEDVILGFKRFAHHLEEKGE